MDRQEIFDSVRTIMHRDGPDGHTDGSDVLTDFIEAALEGRGTDWMEKYRSAVNYFEPVLEPGEDTWLDKPVEAPTIILPEGK